MSAIRNQKVHSAADFAKLVVPIALITAISQTDKVAFSWLPGFRYQIVSIQSFNSAKAGTIAGVVKCGVRTAAAVAFTAATRVAATLSTTKANLRGSSTEAITLEYTSDGSGALTNGFVVVTIRPWPLSGDLGPST